MKYMFLLFLVLPNVLCFIIKSPRRFSKSSKTPKSTIKLEDEYCEDKYEVVNMNNYTATNALTGHVEMIYPKVCPLLSKKCHDPKCSAGCSYYCNPEHTYICKEKYSKKYVDPCPSIRIITGCTCGYFS